MEKTLKDAVRFGYVHTTERLLADHEFSEETIVEMIKCAVGHQHREVADAIIASAAGVPSPEEIVEYFAYSGWTDLVVAMLRDPAINAKVDVDEIFKGAMEAHDMDLVHLLLDDARLGVTLETIDDCQYESYFKTKILSRMIESGVVGDIKALVVFAVKHHQNSFIEFMLARPDIYPLDQWWLDAMLAVYSTTTKPYNNDAFDLIAYKSVVRQETWDELVHAANHYTRDSIMYIAARLGRYDVIGRIIDTCNDPISVIDLVPIAREQKSMYIVRMLLKYEKEQQCNCDCECVCVCECVCECDEYCDYQESLNFLLRTACSRGDETMVGLIVGSQSYKRNRGFEYPEENPVYLAIAGGHLTIADMLLRTRGFGDDDVREVLLGTTSTGNADVLKYFLDRYKDLDLRPQASISYALRDDNITPEIASAAAQGHVDIVALYLQDARTTPEDCCKALYKVDDDGVEVIKMLMQDCRVDPTYMNNAPLRHAIRGAYPNKVRMLMADPRVVISADFWPTAMPSLGSDYCPNIDEVLMLLIDADVGFDPSIEGTNELIRGLRDYEYVDTAHKLLDDWRVIEAGNFTFLNTELMAFRHRYATLISPTVPASACEFIWVG